MQTILRERQSLPYPDGSVAVPPAPTWQCLGVSFPASINSGAEDSAAAWLQATCCVRCALRGPSAGHEHEPGTKEQRNEQADERLRPKEPQELKEDRAQGDQGRTKHCEGLCRRQPVCADAVLNAGSGESSLQCTVARWWQPAPVPEARPAERRSTHSICDDASMPAPQHSKPEHLPDPCPDENLLYFQRPQQAANRPCSLPSTGRSWRTAARGAWRSMRSSIPQSPKTLRDCLSVPGQMRSRPRLPNRVPLVSARARPAVLQAAACRLQARTTHLDGVHYSQCLWRRRLARLLAARALAPGAGRSSDHCAPADWPQM